MKFIRKLIAVSCLFSASFFGANSASATCAAVVQDYMNWIGQSNSRYENSVVFTYSSSKEQAKYVAYGEGRFNRVVGTQLTSTSPSNVMFSDRKFSRNCTPGSICIPNQGFDTQKPDQTELKLGTNGVLTVVLKTWGNATYNIQMNCTNGYAHGLLVEPNGSAMVVLSLKKDRTQIPW